MINNLNYRDTLIKQYLFLIQVSPGEAKKKKKKKKEHHKQQNNKKERKKKQKKKTTKKKNRRPCSAVGFFDELEVRQFYSLPFR